MSKWNSCKFGEMVVCNPKVELEKGSSYRLVDIDSITVGRRFVEGKGPETFDGQSGCRFNNGDTVMARITPCLENGKVAQVRCDTKCGFGSTELFVFRGKKDCTDSNYVYYLMSMPFVRNYAANSMTGASGRQRADLNFIKKMNWNFPSIPEQERIASVLSAYDDLIENNNKRIKILEQMAENLYKEWFVRFRFPGHENAEFENGIPKGWEMSELCDVANYFCEKIDSETVSQYVSTENMQKNYGGLDRSIVSEKPEAKVTAFCKNDILVSNIRPYFKKIWFASEDGGCSNDVLNIRANQKVTAIYLFYALKRDDFFVYMTAGANGTKMPRGNKDFTMKFNLVVPSNDVMEAFSKITENIRKEIELLLRRSVILSKQRDLLLPRLMSGKLSV